MKPARKPEPGPNVRHLRAQPREWADTVLPDPPQPAPPPWWRKSHEEWCFLALLALAATTLVGIFAGWL